MPSSQTTNGQQSYTNQSHPKSNQFSSAIIYKCARVMSEVYFTFLHYLIQNWELICETGFIRDLQVKMTQSIFCIFCELYCSLWLVSLTACPTLARCRQWSITWSSASSTGEDHVHSCARSWWDGHLFHFWTGPYHSERRGLHGAQVLYVAYPNSRQTVLLLEYGIFLYYRARN